MKKAEVFTQRRCGVLLHITSLPSSNLGKDAFRFVDFLQQAGVTVWQMLPLGPTHSDGSPYQCLSAHAGNLRLICMEKIKAQRWANAEELVGGKMSTLIALAYRQFCDKATEAEQAEFHDFCQQQAYWLDDYVMFREIRHLHHSTAWFDWPVPLRDRQKKALDDVRQQRADSLNIRRFQQYIFFSQWAALKHYANARGINMFGDMPIFVAHDSADVWAAPHLFALDEAGQPLKVAGVPPDYFSATGQRWGNPLYQWQQHIDEDFVWWQQRLKTQLGMFDLIRIDHFRGFDACWEIPASSETAIEGQWVKAPGEALFDNLLNFFGELPVVAEDLGIITHEVDSLRQKYAMPGMKILQFAYGGDASNPYLPHQHEKNSVVYTGTHDNNTTMGWYHQLDDLTRQHLHDYAGSTHEAMPWLLIRQALQSVSELAVVPLQDLLALDASHRMNIPGTTDNNWRWRFSWDLIPMQCAEGLRTLNVIYGRIPSA